MTILPRYPVYVPSKGRADRCVTADRLGESGVPFSLVVEPQEADVYRARYGAERVLVLPFRDLGSVIPARNWIKDHATAAGAARHWQLDDNIKRFQRLYRGKRLPCVAGVALRVVEDLADRYENVGLAGLDYTFFVHAGFNDRPAPFLLNHHVYSCSLVDNALPYRWRGRYNEDTDYCLQVLAGGRCTILVSAFMADKMTTMTVRGGNTDQLYAGDGRLKMARALERLWPGVVKTRRRFKRPQHVVNWSRFDRPLIRRPDVDLTTLSPIDEYGLELRAVADVRSPRLRALVDEYAAARRTV